MYELNLDADSAVRVPDSKTASPTLKSTSNNETISQENSFVNAYSMQNDKKYLLGVVAHDRTVPLPRINDIGRYNNVYIDTNKIVTVYGKSKLRDYIQKELRKGNLVRIKKRNIQDSEWASPINAHYEMNVSKDNISQPDIIVKNNNMQKDGTINRAYQLQDIIKIPAASVRVQNNPSSLTNTASTSCTVTDLFNFVKQNDSEFNPTPSSLLLDKGKPLAVYHGTDAKFDEFDMSKGRANMDIQGSFFSPYGKVEIHLYKETQDGYVRILTVASKERNSLQVTKLIGVSKEKFVQKYSKK